MQSTKLLRQKELLQPQKHLYTQLRCPNEKPPPTTGKGRNSLTAGKAYSVGGLTVKFDPTAKRHDILQDDKKYLALGTTQKGKLRYRLLMMQEPIKETGTPTRQDPHQTGQRVIIVRQNNKCTFTLYFSTHP